MIVLVLTFVCLMSCKKNDPIDPQLYCNYIENFFTFYDSCGRTYALNEKYLTQYNCTGSLFNFKPETNHYEFYNNCSNIILASYYDYIDSKVVANCNTDKDSIRKVIIERVCANNEYKQSFYSIYCQYYNIDLDMLFGVKIFKKETLSIDSLENIALLSVSIDAVDPVKRFLISHFCSSAGSPLIKDVSTKLIYFDVASAIMTNDVKELYRACLKQLNDESKARIIDGDSIEEIRKKIEIRLRNELKESGVIKDAIMASYNNKKFTPYIIK